MAKGDGIKLCEDALERLLSDKPKVSKHYGLSKHKITAGIVSVEAGFDRGYLKRTRKTHFSLLERLDTLKSELNTSEVSHADIIRRARIKAEKAVKAELLAKDQLHKVLTQNLQLVEYIRELESQLEKTQNLHQI